MKWPTPCEHKHDYYNITPPANHAHTDPPQTHYETDRQHEECEDHLETAECTGDSGYSGSGTTYIKLPIYEYRRLQNVPPPSRNMQRSKTSCPLLFYMHFSTRCLWGAFL